MKTCSHCQAPVSSPYTLNKKHYCPSCVESELPRLMREQSDKAPGPPSDEGPDDWMFMSDEDFYLNHGKQKP